MALKVMVKEMRALLSEPRSVLITLAAPFLFRLFLPGFDGGTFPAILVAYVVLALFSGRTTGPSIKTGLWQFPVRFKDHLAGLFLFQAAAVSAAALVAWAFVLLSGPQHFMAGVIPKALGICLGLTGVLTLMGLWLRQEIARVAGMVVTILVLNFFIFESGRGGVFMAFISSQTVLLAGLAVWGLCLVVGLRFPRQQ